MSDWQSERLREFDKILERVNEMLVKAAPRISDPDARRLVDDAIKQTRILYHSYETAPDATSCEILEAAVSAAIRRADEKAKIDGEPAVVVETSGGQILITSRSRFERERPFGTSAADLVYDTETGRKTRKSDS